jgi:hypothetical protein
MARRDVIEITCDRCGRTETQSSAEAAKPGVPEIQATFHDEKICFNDLCKRCRAAVKGYFTRMVKKEDDQVPAAAPEKKPEAAPVAPVPLAQAAKKPGLFGR